MWTDRTVTLKEIYHPNLETRYSTSPGQVTVKRSTTINLNKRGMLPPSGALVKSTTLTFNIVKHDRSCHEHCRVYLTGHAPTKDATCTTTGKCHSPCVGTLPTTLHAQLLLVRATSHKVNFTACASKHKHPIQESGDQSLSQPRKQNSTRSIIVWATQPTLSPRASSEAILHIFTLPHGG